MMFPWMQPQWNYLSARVEKQQVPHAILLNGPAGIGKHHFAMHFAQGLLCESPQPNLMACGQCRSCSQFLAKTHPDLLDIHPEEDSRVIKIDQVRTLVEIFTLASHYGGYRIAVIYPAEAMNTAAANSLLKTLEEPPARTVLLLISHQLSLIPATLRSRCQRLDFHLPDMAQSHAWLAGQSDIKADEIQQALRLVEGAPFLARSWIQEGRVSQFEEALSDFCALGQGKKSALDITSSWLKGDHPVPIQWLYHWLTEAIKAKIQPKTAGSPDVLHNLAQQIDLNNLFKLLEQVTEALAAQSVALNRQVQYESILLSWAHIQGSANKDHRGTA